MAEVRHIGLFPFQSSTKGNTACLPQSNPTTLPEFQWENSSFRGNIASAVAFYWRIKRLRFSISATIRLQVRSGDEIIFDEQDSGSGYADVYRQDIATETDFVCKPITNDSYAIETSGANIVASFANTDPPGQRNWRPVWYDPQTGLVNFQGIFDIAWISTSPDLDRESASVKLGYPANYFDPAPTVFDPEYKLEFLPVENLFLTTTKTTAPEIQVGGVGNSITRTTIIHSFNVETIERWPYLP